MLSPESADFFSRDGRFFSAGGDWGFIADANGIGRGFSDAASDAVSEINSGSAIATVVVPGRKATGSSKI